VTGQGRAEQDLRKGASTVRRARTSRRRSRGRHALRPPPQDFSFTVGEPGESYRAPAAPAQQAGDDRRSMTVPVHDKKKGRRPPGPRCRITRYVAGKG